MISQIIVLVLWSMRLGVTISKHGQVKSEEKHNVWRIIIGIAIAATILYYGGFWDKLI